MRIKHLICILLFTASIQAHAVEDTLEKKYLTCHHEHISDIQKSIITYLESNALFPLKRDGATRYLSEDPVTIQVIDANHFITLVPGKLEQDEVEAYNLFFAQQQVDPYEVSLSMLYTCDDEQLSPSLGLYCEIKKALSLKSSLLTKPKWKIHISSVETRKDGSYIQDWIVYNDNDIEKSLIEFTPDGVGGTYYDIKVSN